MNPPLAHPAHHVYTLLGIRFWDPVESAPVRQGLVVRAWPENRPAEATDAIASGSGIYAFPHLPGMHELEFPLDGAEPWDQPTKTFVVEAQDPGGRFLPLVFSVQVPHKGVFPPQTLSSPPNSSATGAWLYSAPTRPVLPGWAVIRASLLDTDTNQSAAYALLEVRINGQVWHGIAGENGNVLVAFPFPNFLDPQLYASPIEPILQSWEARVQVRYQPDHQRLLAGSPYPTLKSIFDQETAALHGASPADLEQVEEMVYPEPLVLRTPGQSFLGIIPAITSP